MTDARIDLAALDALLDPYDRTNAPGFAVGVALRGVPGYRRGAGLASVELPVALSPTIRMRIGSTSKHFCALALMLLAEEGKLSIDDSPRRVLPELPDWAEKMTVRQLMAHTSGMRDSFELFFHTSGAGGPVAPDLLYRMSVALDDLDFEPGTSWSYNNGGYVLLTEMVERLGGEPFADFLRKRILEPVGMYDTLHRPLDTDLVPNSATLHVPSPAGGWTRGIFPVPIGGMGGMVSTVDDMLLWLRHMSSPIVGSAQTWAAMRTPLGGHGYGLGLSMSEHHGLSTVHHAGSVVGGRSQMLKVLDHELDVVVLSNGLGILELYGLVDDIIAACIPGVPKAAETAAANGSGTFYSAATGRVLALVEKDDKQLLDVGGAALPTWLGPDEALQVAISFFPSDLLVRPIREGGLVTMLQVSENGRTERLNRVEPPEGTTAAAIAGRFANAASVIDATVTEGADGGATLRLGRDTGSLEYAMTPITAAVWQAQGPPEHPLVVTLEFDADGFRLSNGRLTRLRFARVS